MLENWSKQFSNAFGPRLRQIGPNETSKDTMMRYLTFRDLQAKLGGRGRSTIYRDIDAGRLPKPIKFGGRRYWIEAEIDTILAGFAETVAD